MYATQFDYLYVCYYYFRRKAIHLIQSYECNLSCPHCVTNIALRKRHNAEGIRHIDEKYIDECIDFLKNDGLMVITGGEPMLHPHLCKYICDKCRENKIISVLYTNGFWGDDETQLKYVKDEIMPDYLGISLDKVHNRQISLGKIYNIVDYFMPDDISTKVYFNHVVEIGLLGPIPDKYRKIFCQPIEMFQSLTNINICTRMGYEIFPNGEVEAFCSNKMGSPCQLGKLMEGDSLRERIKKIKQPCICIFKKKNVKNKIKEYFKYYFMQRLILYTVILVVVISFRLRKML